MKGLVDQIAVCCGAQLSDRSKLLWIFVATGGRGRGKEFVCERLGWVEEDFVDAYDELSESGLIRRRMGKLTAGPFAIEARDDAGRPVPPSELDSDAPRTTASLEECVSLSLSIYNVYRVAGGAPPAELDTKSRKKLTQLVAWLIDESITFAEYLGFVVDHSNRFLRERALKVMPLNILTGDWAREQWLLSKGTGPTQEDKAQSKKDLDLDAIRKYLSTRFDIKSLSRDDLRYIYEWAMNMIDSSTFYPKPPEDFADEVLAVKRGLECGAIRA